MLLQNNTPYAGLFSLYFLCFWYRKTSNTSRVSNRSRVSNTSRVTLFLWRYQDENNEVFVEDDDDSDTD